MASGRVVGLGPRPFQQQGRLAAQGFRIDQVISHEEQSSQNSILAVTTQPAAVREAAEANSNNSSKRIR